MRKEKAEPSAFFKKDFPRFRPVHLAHAISALTHPDTQAMARAKLL